MFQCKLLPIGIFLLSLCVLTAMATLCQYAIIYTLYLEDEMVTFSVHIIVSLVPSILTFLYLLYCTIFWGDTINPLLPFIMIWKSYINPQTKIDKSKLYKRCNSRHHPRWLNILYQVITFGIVVTFISLLSQIIVIIASLLFAVSAVIKQPKNLDILGFQAIHMIPNFFMYSGMLFAISFATEPNLALFLMIYWIVCIIYVILYVTCYSSWKQPSDLVMVTELLLLFAVLYIALLIDYHHNDLIHTISVFMLIFGTLLDGCFLKSVPIKEYEEYSKHSVFYQKREKKVNLDKLYCLMHDTVYHTEEEYYRKSSKKKKRKNQRHKGYLSVPIMGQRAEEMKLQHDRDSVECYGLQHQFMKMSENEKQKRIDQMLRDYLSLKNKRWDKKWEKRTKNLYWFLSVIVGLYPMAWLFYGYFIADPGLIEKKELLSITVLPEIFVLVIVCLYAVMLTMTLWSFYRNFDKYQFMAKLKQVDNVTHNDYNTNILKAWYRQTQIFEEIVNVVEDEVGIAFEILLYIYGDSVDEALL